MLFAFAATLAAANPALPPAGVRAMIRDAKALVQRQGSAVWPGFDTIPFHMILVTADADILFCNGPVDGFRAIGTDPISGCTVQTRKRLFDLDLSASFPVGDELSMIVIGMPKALGLTRNDWVLTLAHEAFHQYQSRLPDYAAKVDELGLASSAANGSWMLDYPFPYADPALGAAVEAMATAGLAFLEARTPALRQVAIGHYIDARRRAMSAVKPVQWRYYEFQIGQEGVARWTEWALAEAGSRRNPGLATAAKERRLSLIASLRSIRQQGVRVWKRGAFYELGSVECHMLVAMGLPWRETYTASPFAFGVALERACIRAGCGG
ncbi:MAG: hypothetical protein C0474_04975 [Sphingobium sp.]|jgi:hypothetical protein|nr:hypothetical protein [Sphingobium sp.]